MGQGDDPTSWEVSGDKATYRAHSGNDVTFYNDASENAEGSAGAFHDIEAAMAEAEHFIFVADWSFHPYMRLTPSSPPVGQQLVDWAKQNESRLVAIHTWDHTDIAVPDRDNDNGGDIFENNIGKPPNLLWRMSSRTGLGWSHHQKIVVMDCPWDDPWPGDGETRRTIRAFLGGLDLTQGRFDWREHPFMPDDPACASFLELIPPYCESHDWYNAEFGPPELSEDGVDESEAHPRQPWHDIHCQIIGPSAWDVVREFVGRWNRDPSSVSALGDTDLQAVVELFQNVLFNPSLFVQQWEDHPGAWSAQILRSMVKDHWGSPQDDEGNENPIETPTQDNVNEPDFVWTIDHDEHEQSIQDAYLQAISQAQEYIYLETQYFIGSGNYWASSWAYPKRPGISNKVPEALIQRILHKAQAQEPFHVYLIIPMFPEGDPTEHANQTQRTFQWRTINHIIMNLAQSEYVEDWRQYFTVGFLANWSHMTEDLLTVDTPEFWKSGVESNPHTGEVWVTPERRKRQVMHNKRYMIYVHSKFMLIDDRYLIIGSANLNERSLAGDRDSEICASLWPHQQEMQCVDQVREFRHGLWSEHFGNVDWEQVSPADPTCVEYIRHTGLDNWLLLNWGKHRHSDSDMEKRGHFCCWPIGGNEDGLIWEGAPNDFSIFDGGRGQGWRYWHWELQLVGHSSAAE